MSWIRCTTALLAATGLAISGCADQTASRFGADNGAAPGWNGLPGLIAVPPAKGFEAGGGGLAGGVWTVPGMPGVDGAGDKGVAADASESVTVGGARVRLTGLVGSGNGRKKLRVANGLAGAGRFVVRDTQLLTDSDAAAGVVFDSDRGPDAGSCAVAAGVFSCVVPAGNLAVGGSYRVDATSQGVTEARLFTVTDAPAVSGAFQAGFSGREIETGAGSFSMGLSFSSAEQGVTANSASAGGFRAGLPQGWSFTGLPGNAGSVTVADAGGFQGYRKLLTVRMGSTPTVLGCKEPNPESGVAGCEALTGEIVGVGLSGAVRSDGSAIVTDSGSASSWWFDAAGRFVRYEGAASLPMAVEYVGSANLLSKVFAGNAGQPGSLTWEFFYGGDQRCAGSIPDGFAPVPNGLLCGWLNPGGDWVRLFYTQPTGGVARLSRVAAASDGCSGFDPGGCDWKLLGVTDYGWNERDQLVGVRDKAQSLAVMAGSLGTDVSLAVDPSLLLIDYEKTDDGSGHPLARVVSQTQPATSPGTPQVVARRTYSEFAAVDASWAPATRTVYTAVAAGSEQPMEQTQAFDDLSRPIWSQSADGSVEGFVWAGRNLLLADISHGQVTASVYDDFGRENGQFRGPTTAFPKSCQPTASEPIDLDGCAPTDMGQVVATTVRFDQIDSDHVQPGWSRFDYANPDFAGVPVKVAAEVNTPDQASAGEWSLPTPRSGGGAKFSGSLVLPLTQVDIDLSSADPDLDGLLWIGGKAVCELGQSGCQFDNTAEAGAGVPGPAAVRLDLSRRSTAVAPAGNSVSLRLVDGYTGEPIPVVAGQRWGVATEISASDPLPVAAEKRKSKPKPKGYRAGSSLGSTGINVTTQQLRYGLVFDSRPDRVAQSSSSGQLPGQIFTSVSSMVAEPGSHSTARITTQTTSAGTYRTSYWGFTETPLEAGMPAEQLGELAEQPQYGKVRSVTDPTGRVATMVYDKWGNLACQASEGSGSAAELDFSCVTADLADSTRTSVSRGDNGQGRTTVVTKYELTTDPATPMKIIASITEGPDAGNADSSVLSVDGQLLAYTDSVGTASTYTYTPLGQLDTVRIVPKDGPAQTTTYGYDPYKRLAAVSIDGRSATSIKYHPVTAAPDLAGLVSAIDYGPGSGSGLAGASLSYQYGETQVVSRVWSWPSGRTVADALTKTRAGRLLRSEFNGATSSYFYDAGVRLVRARIDGTDFSYGYDDATHLSCTAPNQSNPTDLPCQQLPDHYETTWINDQPASSTIPGAAIPARDAYTSRGDLTQIGDMNLSYTPSGQLAAAATNTVSQRLDFGYDPQGRISARTLTEPATPTSGPAPTSTTASNTTLGYGYAAPGADSPAVLYPAGKAPIPLVTLPGGVTSAAGKALLTDMSGRWSLPINADGTLGKAGFTGPYGEYADFGQPARASILERVATTKTRAYSPQLGIFTAPDPAVYPGTSQYGYTPGDPMNYRDPNGTTSAFSGSGSHQTANLWIRIIGPILGVMAAGLLSFGLYKNKRFRHATGRFGPMIANLAFLSLATGAVIAGNFCTADGCSSKNINKKAFWVEIGLISFLTLTSLAGIAKGIADGGAGLEVNESYLADMQSLVEESSEGNISVAEAPNGPSAGESVLEEEVMPGGDIYISPKESAAQSLSISDVSQNQKSFQKLLSQGQISENASFATIKQEPEDDAFLLVDNQVDYGALEEGENFNPQPMPNDPQKSEKFLSLVEGSDFFESFEQD